MNTPPQFASTEWDQINLVVFDMDGTLYRQLPVRLRMLRDMLLHALWHRDANVIAVVARYRRIRERLGDQQTSDFERILISETAASTSNSADRVRAIVSEWIERRPARYLSACRYPGLRELFSGLRQKKKSIGILSDYPVQAKLLALQLTADYVVTASDAGVGCLKPHPRGLQALIAAAGVEAHATLVIGDRAERDGLVARRVGARALIRSSRRLEGWQTFAAFDDALFVPILAS
jgi:HAD superfamily hydrolase (TIGR01549 family)